MGIITEAPAGNPSAGAHVAFRMLGSDIPGPPNAKRYGYAVDFTTAQLIDMNADDVTVAAALAAALPPNDGDPASAAAFATMGRWNVVSTFQPVTAVPERVRMMITRTPGAPQVSPIRLGLGVCLFYPTVTGGAEAHWGAPLGCLLREGEIGELPPWTFGAATAILITASIPRGFTVPAGTTWTAALTFWA